MKKIDIFNLSKYLKRTGDNKLARIGHVNHVIGNTIPLPENPQNGDALVYNSTTGLWESGSVGGGDEWQETIVNFTETELSVGGTYELLPLLSGNDYYEEMVIETFGTLTSGEATQGASNSLIIQDETMAVGFMWLQPEAQPSYNKIFFDTLFYNNGISYVAGNLPKKLQVNFPEELGISEANLTIRVKYKTITFGA